MTCRSWRRHMYQKCDEVAVEWKILKKIKRNTFFFFQARNETKLKICEIMVHPELTMNYTNRINRFNGWYLLIQFGLTCFASVVMHSLEMKSVFFVVGLLLWPFLSSYGECLKIILPDWISMGVFVFILPSFIPSGAAHRVTDLLISDTNVQWCATSEPA